MALNSKSTMVTLYSPDRKVFFMSAKDLADYYGITNNQACRWISKKTPNENGVRIYRYDIPREEISIYREKIHGGQGKYIL